MQHPGFFKKAGPFSLGEIASALKIDLAAATDDTQMFSDVKTLTDAGADHLSFLDNVKYKEQCQSSSAGAIFIAGKSTKHMPENATALIVDAPYHCFAKALALFYPDSLTSKISISKNQAFESSLIHPTAEFEEDVIIEPGAVIGPEVRIGSGTRVTSGAVIGYRVYIGRNCFIGPNVSLSHSLVGDHVTVHAGASIGQDGFGFAIGPTGHLKVPQIGRVILQDHVDIGANTTIDRGALKDTIIGEGTKIDNLVQIGHNVVIGRHCIIVSQTGISGSTELGDFVFLSGQCGLLGHLKIGSGAQLGGRSGLMHDMPPGAKWIGYPAKPMREWGREKKTLENLAKQKKNSEDV